MDSRGFGRILVFMAKALLAFRYRRIPSMLRKMREQAGLIQHELGKRLKFSQPLVHKTEIGERRGELTEFLDWCLACGVDPETAFRELLRHRHG